MKTVKRLIETENEYKRMGNHYVVKTQLGRNFYYHYTAIVSTNDSWKTFLTNNGGWNTQSTTRAINAYRRQLKELGYVEKGAK